MATVVVMPKVGISVESCIITKWHKKKGDAVKTGDLLFSYETDKASVDEEAKADGVLLEIFCEEGDDVPVLNNVCVIGNAGEDISSFIPAAAKEAVPEVKAEPVKEVKAESVKEAAPAAPVNNVNVDNIKVSPRAKGLAEKSGVDLRFASPTGPEGRIIERDIRALIENGTVFTKAALEAKPEAADIEGTGIGGRVTVSDLNTKPVVQAAAVSAPVSVPASSGEYETVKLSNVRKIIAKSMQNSLNTMAQLTLNASFDATEIMKYRKMLKANGTAFGLQCVTINDIILYAVSRTIKNHRNLNAHLVNDTMLYFKNVSLGIAVDTEKGLLVPTLFGADKLSLGEISSAAKIIIADAQKGTITPDLLTGATFTITNLGALDVESFTPVINPPQTGILGVCVITQKVKEVDGKITVYPSMGLSLTFDHRAIDGAPAARFLKELKTYLENFNVLLAK